MTMTYRDITKTVPVYTARDGTELSTMDDCVRYERLLDKFVNDITYCCDFLFDPDKMTDFFELSKEEFLQTYSYATEAEYNNTKRRYEKAVEIYLDRHEKGLDV